MLKPLLKYAGSKKAHFDLIDNLFIASGKDRLVDLTCGGCYVPLQIAQTYRNAEIYINDLNPSISAFFKYVQRSGKFDDYQLNNPNLYYLYREKYNKFLKYDPTSDSIPQLFYYLNRWCHSGIIRYNKANEFNVPLGKAYTKYTGLYPDQFESYSRLIRNWKITNLDYREVLITNFDFVVFDPPYFSSNLDYYSPNNFFGYQDHLDAISYLGSKKCPMVLFNSYSHDLEQEYKKHGFYVKVVDKQYACNADMTGRSKKNPEIVAYKNIV